MMTEKKTDDTFSSPALVETAILIRSYFNQPPKRARANVQVTKAIIKASEIATIYYRNKEEIDPKELDVLYDVLREFGIVASHIPSNFHVHCSNVLKNLKRKEDVLTPSHVSSIIFTKA